MNIEDKEKGILIRPFCSGDTLALFEAARESIDAAFPWLEWCHPDYAEFEARDWTATRRELWEDQTDYCFAIESSHNGTLLGGVGLNQIDWLHKRANLGYWVRTGQVGNGIGTTATKLLSWFGLAKLGLGRIEIIAATDNTGSQRVAEKAGATREGVLRNRLLLHGRYHDAVSYSFVGADLKGLGTPD